MKATNKTTATKLTLIRHTSTSTMKWYNMTVKHGHYYGYLTVGDSVTPVFWSGWISASAIYLYNAITCMADWVDECDLDDPRIYIVGGEPYVEDYDNAISEWAKDSYYGYRPNEGDYLPFWIYNIYDGWNPLYM